MSDGIALSRGIAPSISVKRSEHYAADASRAQRQFEGLMARYPDRTFGHPDVSEIFSSAYPVVARPQ